MKLFNRRMEERSQALTRGDVIDGFRWILGREPESEQVILQHMTLGSRDALRKALIQESERRGTGFHREADAESTYSHNFGGQKKLLLVGIPRGITSFAYQQICRVTKFVAPDYVTDGEILNPQRFDSTRLSSDNLLNDFYRRIEKIPFYSKNSELFGPMADIMNSIPPGMVVKDVVQPWFINEYLSKYNHEFFVIYLKRPLEQIQFALDRRGWDVFKEIDEIDAIYSQFPTINVNSALYDSEYISLKLEMFGIPSLRFEYIDENFCSRTDQFFSDFYSKVVNLSDDIESDSLGLAAWCYRFILGREPESDQVVANLARLRTLPKMRVDLLRSKEFASLYYGINPNKPTDALSSPTAQ